MAVSHAQVAFKAVRLASEAKIEPGLRQLCAEHNDVLNLELVLRIILSYLPESTEPQSYTDFLKSLVNGNLSSLDETSSTTSEEDVPEEEAVKQLSNIALLQIAPAPMLGEQGADLLTCFLVDRAHRIEHETGSLLLLRQLVEPFVDHSEYLRTWYISVILPLLRLDYDYYPQDTPSFTLEHFATLRGVPGVQQLMSKSLQSQGHQGSKEFGRDLRGVVGPWMYGQNIRKKRKLNITEKGRSEEALQSCWTYTNEWLLNVAAEEFQDAVRIIDQWNGPQDVDFADLNTSTKTEQATEQADELAYAQAGLAAVYTTSEVETQTLDGIENILERLGHLLSIDVSLEISGEDNLPSSRLSTNFLKTVKTSHLLESNLLDGSNPVTIPSADAFELVSLVLRTTRTLASLRYHQPVRRTLQMALFSTLNDQRTAIRKIFHDLHSSNPKNARNWKQIRQQMLWLRDWGKPDQEPHAGFLSEISVIELETEILKALLMGGQYELVAALYCYPDPEKVTKAQVEKAILDVALMYYDGASNGNKTRGGIKKSNDILTNFKRHFPGSVAFEQSIALIQATHSLSFYSLILEHGVPFQPVNIRVNQEPLSLIDKALQQNSKSYTKLDDLIQIGQNLVKAGLVHYEDENHKHLSEDEKLNKVAREVTAKAIDASLAEGDFDTAYSYVVNRLSISHSEKDDQDDILWQAAHRAGCYRPKNSSGPSHLRRLEQRMELLSQALLLAPTAALETLLSSWRECEDDFNKTLADEADIESAWNQRGDGLIPGAFGVEPILNATQKPRESTRSAINEEAPMGLFDVARGAAAALSKSAFSSRGHMPNSPTTFAPPQHNRSASSIHSDSGSHEGEGRVRKRDMMSNMVTGGLASGIGWVLGAPPVRQE